MSKENIFLFAMQEVLKSDVRSMVQLNIDKNLIGSALSGSIGGIQALVAEFLNVHMWVFINFPPILFEEISHDLKAKANESFFLVTNKFTEIIKSYKLALRWFP